MDRYLALIALVVVASGCTQLPGGSSGGSSQGEVRITSFSAPDQDLRPGQRSSIRAVVESTADIQIENLTIYGLGDLRYTGSDIEDWRSNCAGDLSSAGDRPGVLECRWDIRAPPESSLGAVPSKTYRPKMLLRYTRNFSNSDQPIKVHFRSQDEIKDIKDYRRKFSNGEVSMTADLENPVPVGRSIAVSFELSGAEDVLSDKYVVRPRPVSVFESCSGVDAGSIERLDASRDIQEQVEEAREFSFLVRTGFNDRAEFRCVISSGQEVTRNLLISTSYKYQRSPSITVEVTNQ